MSIRSEKDLWTYKMSYVEDILRRAKSDDGSIPSMDDLSIFNKVSHPSIEDELIALEDEHEVDTHG